MKKVFWISGIITVLLLSLILTGMVNTDDSAYIALRQGNMQFASGEYENALRTFEIGLEAAPENNALNFSAGQSAYMLGEYEKAIEYFDKSEDSIEKFLNSGNASFRLGESGADEQQLQNYTQAMETFHRGIIRFPQNIELKYNYEVIREIINDLLNDTNQDNEQGDDNQEQDNEEQNGSDDGQNPDQGEDLEDSQQDQENSDSSQQAQEESEESQAQDPEQEEAPVQEQNEEESEQQGEENSTQEEGDELDREATERILRILEGMESESLKNNQEVTVGDEGNYAW